MADWEDEDFDPDAGFAKASAGDKWEGEDEEEDVKDDWDASDDDGEKKNEASGETSSEGGAFQVKKKKNTLEQALKKKAEKRKEKLEEKVTLTPEEEMEEKLRQQKLVEEADFELAKEAFGVGMDNGKSIDSMHPTTEEDFEEFGRLLKEKLAKLESSDYYQSLLEDVFQSCCVCLDSDQVKKLSSSLTAIANEKTKAQKALKGKKGKKKAVLAGSGKSAKKDEFDDFAYGGDEFDDFM